MSWVFLLAPALVVAGCNRTERAPASDRESQPQKAVEARAPERAPAPATSLSPVVLKETPPPHGKTGEWIDAKLYRLRVGRVLRCAEGPEQPGAPLRLGVEIEITARADNVFVASRDVALARDGVIASSQHVTRAPKNCQPLLAPTTLQEGKSVSGVVVFDVPDLEFARTALLTYQPTRWGGAPLAEVKLSACLDACGDEK